MREDRAFSLMLQPARAWLAGRDPREIAQLSGAAYDEAAGRLSLESLGRRVELRWPECTLEPELDTWWQLVLLHYLHVAKGTPLHGELINFGALPGGMARGGDYDRRSAAALGMLLGKRELAEIEAACRALGARILPGNADLCAEFSFLPRYPMTLKFWLAEEDIPASARLLLDASAADYLSTEDAVAAGDVLIAALREALERA